MGRTNVSGIVAYMIVNNRNDKQVKIEKMNLYSRCSHPRKKFTYLGFTDLVTDCVPSLKSVESTYLPTVIYGSPETQHN